MVFHVNYNISMTNGPIALKFCTEANIGCGTYNLWSNLGKYAQR